ESKSSVYCMAAATYEQYLENREAKPTGAAFAMPDVIGVRRRSHTRHLPFQPHGRRLSLAGKIDGLGKNARGFLRSVKASAVFGGDEIEAPLSLPLKSTHRD